MEVLKHGCMSRWLTEDSSCELSAGFVYERMDDMHHGNCQGKKSRCEKMWNVALWKINV